MTDRLPKIVLISATILCSLLLPYAAFSRPGYFANVNFLGGLVFLELMVAALWMYRSVFFPIVVMSFLFAGANLPVGRFWTAGRWAVLGLGGFVGLVMMLKDRRYHFSFFHAVAVFAVLAAATSAAVSRYSGVSVLKVLSLASLFLYAGTGARLAVEGREKRFFAGLITGCEIFVAVIGLASLAGIEAMGNPNSLGAVMGVVGAPLLLWGILIAETSFIRRRRLILYFFCAYLVFTSHARAGMIAAFVSCAFLCVALRKYRMLAQALVILSILVAVYAIVRPEAFSQTMSSFTAKVVFKGKDPTRGLFESRTNPWQDAIETIQNNLWFGTGFGTTDNGQDARENLGNFSATSATSQENGSSYLAIAMWVGMIGILPFLMLLAVLLMKIARTFKWMWTTRTPFHPAVPLAMLILAGLVHATFEDWLFAPGYYLCVFFWSLAFVFADIAPSSSRSQIVSQHIPRAADRALAFPPIMPVS